MPMWSLPRGRPTTRRFTAAGITFSSSSCASACCSWTASRCRSSRGFWPMRIRRSCLMYMRMRHSSSAIASDRSSPRRARRPERWTESAFRRKRLSRWRSCADSLRRSRSSFSWRWTAGPGKSPGSCAGFPQMRRDLRTNSLQICRSMILQRRLCTFWDSIFCPSIEARDLRGSL